MRKSRSIVDIGLRKGPNISKGAQVKLGQEESGRSINQVDQREPQVVSARFTQYQGLQKGKGLLIVDESPYGTAGEVRRSEPAAIGVQQPAITTPKTANEQFRQQKERERLINKSLSLSKGITANVYSANKFKATTFIRARQSGYAYPNPFEQAKGLRNRSFLSKERGQGEQQNRSAQNRNLNARDKSNPKNLSINSRLMNPRAMNNLSKNMSINEELFMPESLVQTSKRLQTDVQNKKLAHEDNFDEVSMDSLGSFEEGKLHHARKVKKTFKDNKMSLQLGYSNLSPSKLMSQPIAPFKQQQKRITEEKQFYSQINQSKSSAARQSQSPQVQTFSRNVKRAPLTQKNSQAPRISAKMNEQDKFGNQIEQQNNVPSPFKNQRLSFLIKNKLMVSGKFPKNYQEQIKTSRSLRAGGGQLTQRSPQTPVGGNQQDVKRSKLRYTFNGSIADRAYPINQEVGQHSNTLRENKSSKNLPAAVGMPEAASQRQHKRSMTLKTRNTLKEQVGETFQSIKEEPAEDNARSIDNKTNDDVSGVGDQSEKQFPMVSQRRQSKFQNQQVNKASEVPQSAKNINSQKIRINLNTIQVQQQYGLVCDQDQPNNGGQKWKNVNNKTQTINTPKMRDDSHASLENSENSNKFTSKQQVPQNTKNRVHLRTTRNTIAQHAPDQIAIPEPFSATAANQNQTKNNPGTSKAAESGGGNPTIVYDLQKPSKSKYGRNFTKVTSNTRPTSIQKSQQQPMISSRIRNTTNEKGVVNGSKPSQKQADFLQSAQSSKLDSKDQSKEVIQRTSTVKLQEDAYKSTGTIQKRAFVNKKSRVNQTLINKSDSEQSILVNSKTENQKQQELPQSTKNQMRRGQGLFEESKKFRIVDKQIQSTGQMKNAEIGSVNKINAFGQPKNSRNPSTADGQSNNQTSLSGLLASKHHTASMPNSPTKEESMKLLRSNSEYPLSADQAIYQFKDALNDYEKQEIYDYCGKIFYVGQNCHNKVKGHVIKMVPNTSSSSRARLSKDRRASNVSNQNTCQKEVPSQRQIDRLKLMDIHNYGYDDGNGDYKTVLRDHVGYRFEVLELLGSGSFGQALKCKDHSNGQTVAIKIIRNKKKFQYQAGMELKILLYLNRHDKHDQYNVIRVKDFLLFREHLVIAFELLSINLYDFIKNNNFVGVSQNLIRRFAIQILQALKYQHDHSLVHCDLKPENILLKQENKSGIKVIDYGSSCFMGQRIYTYIQSRFYRAPEIILGIPYTTAIDMWSFGAIVAELYTGFPLFPGESEHEQLAYIMELYGVPPDSVIRLAQRRDIFFTKDYQPKLQPNSRGKIRQPCSKKLEDLLRCTDTNFLDFLNRCFIWDPVKRMTALEALQHPWIIQGLPENVLQHHRKMFGYKDDRSKMRKLTHTAIQGFPKDKKETTIQDIVDEIRKEQEKENAHTAGAKSNMEVSRNQISRQQVQKNNGEGFKSQVREEAGGQGADTLKAQKSQKLLSLNKVREKQHLPIEVAQIHLHASKTINASNPIALKNNSQKQNKSPQKERKSRKQRMENSELKLVNRLASFKNIDQKDKVAGKTGGTAKYNKEMKKSKSIKVYEPAKDEGGDDYHEQSNLDYNYAMQQQHLQKLFHNDTSNKVQNISITQNEFEFQDNTNDQKMSIESNSEDHENDNHGQRSLMSSQRSSEMQYSMQSQHYKPRRRQSHAYDRGENASNSPEKGRQQIRDVTM